MAINDMVEIRWHGRGGQGAKMACMLLADVLVYRENSYRVSRSMDRKEWELLLQRIIALVKNGVQSIPTSIIPIMWWW